MGNIKNRQWRPVQRNGRES